MQTKLQSAVEVVVGVLVAFLLSVVVGQLWIYPHTHVAISLAANASATFWFTAVGLARGYLVRRFFNWLHGRGL